MLFVSQTLDPSAPLSTSASEAIPSTTPAGPSIAIDKRKASELDISPSDGPAAKRLHVADDSMRPNDVEASPYMSMMQQWIASSEKRGDIMIQTMQQNMDVQKRLLEALDVQKRLLERQEKRNEELATLMTSVLERLDRRSSE